VIRAAAATAVPVVVVCGRTTLPPEQVEALGVRRLHALADQQPDPVRCLAGAAALVREAGRQVATVWLARDDCRRGTLRE
jgi:glycerate kinase